jgi:hypothetical protein
LVFFAASDGGSPDAEAGEADTEEGVALEGLGERAVRGILEARKAAESLISHLAGDGRTLSWGLLDGDESMDFTIGLISWAVTSGRSLIRSLLSMAHQNQIQFSKKKNIRIRSCNSGGNGLCRSAMVS